MKTQETNGVQWRWKMGAIKKFCKAAGASRPTVDAALSSEKRTSKIREIRTLFFRDYFNNEKFVEKLLPKNEVENEQKIEKQNEPG